MGSNLATLQAQVPDCLRTASESDPNTIAGDAIFEGCNVHVRNGMNETDTTNERGNLIIGYNEESTEGDLRDGSHNLVVGPFHSYPSYGGMVVGWDNTISGAFASISGGRANTASGLNSSVSGGQTNSAVGIASSVSGGANNFAQGINSSVSGGVLNIASGPHSSISGGQSNTASGDASVVGGADGTVNDDHDTLIGDADGQVTIDTTTGSFIYDDNIIVED